MHGSAPPRGTSRIRLWRVVALLALGLGALYVGGLTLVYLGQRRLVFPAPAGPAPRCRAPGQYLVFEGPAGRRVHVVHFGAPPGEPTLVVFHGNGDTLANMVPLLDGLARAGVGAYGVEYPGYGPASAYAPSEGALYEDAATALEHLERELGVPREQQVLLGHSLGTGVAVEMARRGHGGRMILVAPFTSMAEMGTRLFPYIPAHWLTRDRFDSASKAPAIEHSTLVIHGRNDDLVPVEMGQRLAAAFPRGRLLVVEGAGHNDVLDAAVQGARSAAVRFARDDSGL